MPRPFNRRGFLTGLIAVIAAPAIVRAEILMPVKPVIWTPPKEILRPHDCQWVNAVLEDHYQMVTVVDHPTPLRALVYNWQIAEGFTMRARNLAWDDAQAAVIRYAQLGDA